MGFNTRFVSLFLFVFIVLSSPIPQATSHSSNVSQVPQATASQYSSNVSQVPQATSYDSLNVSQAFEDWMKKYGRVYSSQGEKQKRFAIFQKTFKFVDDFQKDGVKKSYSVGLNDFADWTPEELRFLACSKVELDISTTERDSSSETEYPDYCYGYCENGIVDHSIGRTSSAP